MPFIDFKGLLPAECSEKTRIFIERKLDELDKSIRNLKIKCGMCKINHVMFKENRDILVRKLKKRFPNSMVLLKGKELKDTLESSKYCFKQDSYFYWAFGIEKPNLWGAIDVETGTSYIFYDCSVEGNKIAYSYMFPEHLANKYKIDKVMSSCNEMKYEMSKLGRNLILVLSDMDEKKVSEMNHERVITVLADCGSWLCNTVLTPMLKECRMIKSSTEMYIMDVAAKLNSEGMVFVMRNMKPGLAGYCTGALFDLYITSTSSDHHVAKARPISCLAGAKMFCLDHARSTFSLKENLESGDLCILDMGVALRNYRTNLIATVPVNGVFTENQAVIYNIVLEVRSAMLEELKPGITFAHLAETARKTMVHQMIQNFLLEGTFDEIMESGICTLFIPNGIGHLLGIDFYDCEEETDKTSTRRIRGDFEHLVVKKGMVLALNSELYINEVTIQKWIHTAAGLRLHSRYLPHYFGLAARVQDVVFITSHSKQLLSSIPRTVEEIQKTISDKVDMPFITYRKAEPPPIIDPRRTVVKVNSGKFSVLSRRETDDPYPSCKDGKSNLKLRFDYESPYERRVDLEKILNTIKKIREWKPMPFLNQIMEEVYAYPFKIQNMLELVMIPLVPQRRRPTFIPFPEVSPLYEQIKFPEEGYGCPYFKWNERFESFEALKEACLQY